MKTITKSNLTKKILSIFFAIIVGVSSVIGTTMAAQAAVPVRTGRFDGGTTVYLSRDSRGRLKNAKVKICTFSRDGFRSSSKIKVTLYNARNGRYITSFVTNSGTKIKLGNDHAGYIIRLKAYKKEGNSIKTTGNNWTNLGKCYYWSIDCSKNCHF